MNKFKIFLNFVIITVLFFITNLPVLAADLNIDCLAPPTACSKTGVDPLFSSATDGFWYPGRTLTKTINLKNSSSEKREMAIRGERTSGVSILEEVMHVSIIGGTTVIWSGSVEDFYGQDKIGMGIFAPGVDFDYDFTVSMSSGADDNYQNKETVFDLTLGFWGEPVSTATPTPTSSPTPTSAPGDGGGGAVLGTGVSAPVCSDALPGGAPTLTSAVGGVNSATLTWTPATDPVSYYLIAYGTSSGNYQFGNPNIGGKGTTLYTISGLSGGVTYYFVVRAGNGCAPGTFSNELTATPTGGVVTSPAPGFLPGVLGEATLSGELGPALATEEGEVAGIEIKPHNWWILILIGIVGIGGGFILYFRFFRKK